MKKIFVLIVCLVLVLCTACAVSADEVKHTQVTYSVNSQYTLVVPDSIAINVTGGETHLSIEVTDAVISSSEKIIVTVDSVQFTEGIDDGNYGLGLWTMLSAGGDPLYYHVHKKDAENNMIPLKKGHVAYEATGDQFASLNTGSGEFGITQYLYLHLHNVQPYSGIFSDSLIFTASVSSI